MTISRCLVKQSKAIGELPMLQWAGAIAKLPEVCPYQDCTGNCRKVVADYMRVQYRIKQNIGKTRR